MDNPTVIALLENQEHRFYERMDTMENNLKEFTKGAISLNHAHITNELDPIKDKLNDLIEQKRLQNGRIEKVEWCCDEIKERTRFAMWVQRHPLPASVIALIIVMVGAFAYHNINFRKTVENTTGVVVEQPIVE